MTNNSTPLPDAALAELDRQYGRAESETGTKIDLAVAMNAAYLAYPALRQRLLNAEARLAEAERERDAAEALVAELREALDDAGDVVHACVCETEEIRGKVCHSSCIAINAAISLTPASAGNRIKAEALREAAQRILNDPRRWPTVIANDPRRWPTVIANHIVHDLCAEADRMEKEGANG
jgi:hypothetical protein